MLPPWEPLNRTRANPGQASDANPRRSTQWEADHLVERLRAFSWLRVMLARGPDRLPASAVGSAESGAPRQGCRNGRGQRFSDPDRAAGRILEGSPHCLMMRDAVLC